MEHSDTTQSAVAELPLFPLNVVLFPSMPFALHIFEDRYKEMVNRCVHDSIPFGIVLITEGRPEKPGASTRAVGCAARISRVERLPDGRMNIEVVGERRFRILDTHETRPYRTGLTVPFSDAPADAAAVVPLADEVQKLLRDFLTRSLAIAGQEVGDFALPDEPEQLSFTAACVLPLGNDDKQSLLENTDTIARLGVEKEVLQREVTRLRRAAAALQANPEPVRSEQYAPYHCAN